VNLKFIPIKEFDPHPTEEKIARQLNDLRSTFRVNADGRISGVRVTNKFHNQHVLLLQSLPKLVAFHYFSFDASPAEIAFDDFGLKETLKIKSLREIFVQNAPSPTYQMSDKSTEDIQTSNPALRSILLPYSNISNISVERISILGDLECLGIAGTHITDSCIPSLLKLKKLRVLGVQETSLSRDGVRTLQERLTETAVFSSLELNE
jgi:hypothetical protein